MAEAESYVNFKVAVPGFATADLIQVDNPESLAIEDRTVALVFGSLIFEGEDLGDVIVEESEPGVHSVEQFRAISESPPTGASPGAFQVVSVRGTDGLLVSGNGIGRVIWIESGVLLQILGSRISPDQAQALAKAL